jgi:hypothetical protein
VWSSKRPPDVAVVETNGGSSVIVRRCSFAVPSSFAGGGEDGELQERLHGFGQPESDRRRAAK